jgi:hypothetical protein
LDVSSSVTFLQLDDLSSLDYRIQTDTPSQSFPNQDGMYAQLESHLSDINRTADLNHETRRKKNAAIDLVVVTDSEAILGIGGEFGVAIAAWQTWRSQTRELEVLPSRPRNPLSTRSEQVSTQTGSYLSSSMLERTTTLSFQILSIWVRILPDYNAKLHELMTTGYKRTRVRGKIYEWVPEVCSGL